MLLDRIGPRTVLAAVVLMSLACASSEPARTPTPPPTSRWNGTFSFRWDPPASDEAPQPTGLTVCVVNPDYDEDSLLLEKVYKNFSKGFAKSMGADMDRVFTTKGLTVSGPFDTFDDITYPEKRAAQFAFTPRLFVTAEFEEGKVSFNGDYHEKPILMNIRGQIVYELREPLSNQKLWVKKLELEQRQVRALQAFRNNPVWVQNVGTINNVGELFFDGRQDALADYMEGLYPIIMQKAWTYLDTEEMKVMKNNVDEIRALKRF